MKDMQITYSFDNFRLDLRIDKNIGKFHYFIYLNILYSELYIAQEHKQKDDLEIDFTFLLHNKIINLIIQHIPQQIKVEISGNGNLEFPVLVDLLFKL